MGRYLKNLKNKAKKTPTTQVPVTTELTADGMGPIKPTILQPLPNENPKQQEDTPMDPPQASSLLAPGDDGKPPVTRSLNNDDDTTTATYPRGHTEPQATFTTPEP